MAKKPETKIEESYVTWLRNDFKPVALALKLILFMGNGFPDRTILCRGRVFFIEFKLPNENLCPLQQKWKTTLNRLGFKYYVCTSLEEAIIATKVETA